MAGVEGDAEPAREPEESPDSASPPEDENTLDPDSQGEEGSSESADTHEEVPEGPTCESGTIADCDKGCSPESALANGVCDPALDCEDYGYDGGDCAPLCGDGVCDESEDFSGCPTDCYGDNQAINHPCELSNTPGSIDTATTLCVCALDAWCCTHAWDAFCVQVASESCMAMCECSNLNCEGDEECGACFGDACIGEWTCVQGSCVQGEGITCDGAENEGCLTEQCEPESEACVTLALDSACDDGSACTLDSCEVTSGECVHIPSELCGDQHPCLSASSPGSGEPTIQSCVCDKDPFCCQSAWDEACVALAQEECGLECACASLEEEALECGSDADCDWCLADLCTGPFICLEGICSPSAAVLCEDANDSGCITSTCVPESGACELSSSDALCDDGDPCTLDLCLSESGACEYSPIEGCGENHPCVEATTPSSSDASISACVCGLNPSCCDESWSEECVLLAEQSCDLECTCELLDEDALSCANHLDCAFCDDANLCNGAWLCQNEVCVKTAEVICESVEGKGCLASSCVPETGTCQEGPDISLCDDQDPCTEDLCDGASGACTQKAIAGCGVNHPCVSAPMPTSISPYTTACVCAIDPYCCSAAWDALCVEKAEEQCGETCTCDSSDEPVSCADESDCAGCDDGDLCNGTWACIDGLCSPLGESITCSSEDNIGCLVNTCAPASGACELSPSPLLCDDNDPCTSESCDAAGACLYTAIEGCALTHPCAPSSTPQSSDPELTECVCAQDPWCCEQSWDSLCVEQVISACGASCDCADPDLTLSCLSDSDCTWCSEDLCQAPWTCEQGLCVAGEQAISCETSEESECLVNQCQPSTGQCDMVALPGACEDADPCTLDSCGADGLCTHTPLEGCEGKPPFVCLGSSEPSASGCATVESYEGCCDPWGRVTWCQDGQTYCISCQENPSCGWQESQGYYDCGNDANADPSGQAPMMCPAYAP